MNSLVIFLHGVGSRGADLLPLSDRWSTALPDVAFAAPDAPFSFDQGGFGRQWFSITGVTESNRPQRVSDARAAFDLTIGEIVETNGFASRPERVALVGFSQGAIMALDLIASNRWPVGAVVAFAGRLALKARPLPPRETKILLIHGEADPVIPARESLAARVALEQAGANVELKVLPDVGHAISPAGAETALEFLVRSIEKTN